MVTQVLTNIRTCANKKKTKDMAKRENKSVHIYSNDIVQSQYK